MKNFLSLIIVVAMLCSAVSLISCSGGNSETTEQTSTKGQTTSSVASSQTETTTKAETTASETTTSAETTPAETTTTAKPIIEKPPVLPEGKTLKVLAIGNSFSVDGMEYIYGIAKSAGYTNIVLGNLYIGGCSLSKHESNAKNNAPAYEFFTNTDGKWVSNKSTTIATGLAYTDWDCISIQQVSGYSGLAGSFEPSLTNLISYVKKACPNAKLVWHMTWAYQSNSGHSDFPKYGRDQLKMYNAITSATQKGILEAHKDDFAGVIPSGTAIQNLRTSFFGDTLTRDGYHLSYGIGRYTAALAWFKALTGADLDSVTYIPTEYGYTLGEKAHYCSIAYKLKNTLSENGTVSRGICKSKDGYLVSLDEKTKIERRGDIAVNTEDDGTLTELPLDCTVSMNCFGFTPSFTGKLEKQFEAFLRKNESNLSKCEFYLPSAVEALIESGECDVKLYQSPAKWMGVTYREDSEAFSRFIKEQRLLGNYPDKLWK